MSNTLPEPFTMKNFYTQKVVLSVILISGMALCAQSQSTVAADDDYEMEEGSELTISAPGVLENDLSEFSLTAHPVSEPSHANAPFILQEDGSFVYQHDGSETTSDAFQYTAYDGIEESAPATVNIQIIPVNDAPQISDIPDVTINKGEEFAVIELDKLVTDAENDPADMSWTVNSTVDLDVSVDEETHFASIDVPSESWTGSETITFTVTDTENGTDSDEATFTVLNVNAPPGNLSLSSYTLNENAPASTIIGNFSATDPDVGDVINYSLPAGVLDNNLFNVNAATGALRKNVSADYEDKKTYTVRVRATDAINEYSEADFMISITNVNDVPTDISIFPSTIAENQPIGTNIGTLSSVDQDESETFTYSLASGAPDNSYFAISGNQLHSNTIFNFEGVSSYTPKIRTTDSHGGFYEKTIPVSITNVFEKPTDITLSSSSIAENLPAGTAVGTLTATDPDMFETFTFSLPSGTPDNAFFTISGNELRTAAKFDYETLLPSHSYSINIRCTDNNSQFFDKAFTINVTDVNEGVASITGGGTFCAGAAMTITLNISGGNGPFNLTLTRTLSTSNKDTSITSIGTLPYNIIVRIPGTYTIKALTDKDNNPGTFSLTPVVLVQNPRAKAILTPVTQAICKDGVSLATLHVNFTAGVGPYQIKVQRGNNASNDTTITRAADFDFHSRVFDNTITRHRIIQILDKDNCAGDTTGSGTALVSYKASPVATISGTTTICPGASTPLTITLQGTAPWNIAYRKDAGSPQTITNIQTSPHTLNVNSAGRYTLYSVQDASCTGTVSGEAVITANIVPVATLSGSATICEHTTANLSLAITGSNSPWKFYYKLNSGDSIIVDGIGTSPASIPVSKAGNYSALKIVDKNNCVGTVSGNPAITVTPAPNVTVSGLLPAYNKDVLRVPVSVNPSSSFHIAHPALFPYENVLHFWPTLATIGTHNLVFYYEDPGTHCVGYDTATVRVLAAQSQIFFEKEKTTYCTNDGPFKVTGVNVPNKIGTFTIQGGIGLVDHGDNTATVYPKQLTANTYKITYTYIQDGVPLSVSNNLDIGNKPVANFAWATECYQQGQSISFTNISVSPYGAFTDTSYFWKIYGASSFISKTTRNITHAFEQAGNQTIELQIENSYGCADTIVKIFPLRPTIDLMDDYSESFEGPALGWKSGNSETVNSWQLGTPTSGYIPGSTKCWYTKITSTVPPSEHSWVTSPCYDFTHADKPMVKMNIWRLFNLNTNADGANLQFSADSGKTWTLVGDIADGKNWYNSYIITGLPGGSGIGWSNVKDASWIDSRHSLDMLKGKKWVQFRITYGSDSRVRNTNGIAFDDFSIIDRSRMSLIEHFTNSSDTDTEIADALLDTFTNNNLAHVINIQYHTSNPAGDPFYTDNTQVTNLRQFYYGLSAAPYALLNGGTSVSQRFDYVDGSKPLNTNTVIIESLDDSKFEINMDSKIDQVLRTKVQVGARANISASNISVKIAVIERIINSVPGQNGDQEFMNVVKAMLPSPSGTIYNRAWSKDEVVEIEKTWELQHVYNANELRVVAFIQNEQTHEIYQAAMDTIGIIIYDDIKDPQAFDEAGFTIYPNPANQHATVLFNEETKEDLKIELFNSTGKLVHSTVISAGESSVDIPLDAYPDGLYLMRLVTEDRLLGIRKLVISR